MGRKPPIAFDFQTFVEKHCNDVEWMDYDIWKQGELQYRLQLMFLIWFTSLTMIEKRSENTLKKEMFIFVKILYWLKISLVYEFPVHIMEK